MNAGAIDTLTPGTALLRAVRGGLLLNHRTTFTRWCAEHGVLRQNARSALLGERNGPIAQALRQRLVDAATPRDSTADRVMALCRKIDACLARVEGQRAAPDASNESSPGSSGGRPPELPRTEADIAIAHGLRREGKSYREIAQAIGCTKPHAWRLVNVGPNARTKPYKAIPSDFRRTLGTNKRTTPSRASSAITRKEA